MSEFIEIEMDSRFENDMRENGWELIKDCGFTPVVTSMSDLELVNLFLPEELKAHGDRNPVALRLSGAEVSHRIQMYRSLAGQRHLEWLLQNQELIPSNWVGSIYAVGTWWRSADNPSDNPSQVTVPYIGRGQLIQDPKTGNQRWSWFLGWDYYGLGTFSTRDRYLRIRT